MTVFGQYAQYYNLLYSDKDYAGEAKYVADVLRNYGTDISSVLDIGCGTGIHAGYLAEADYHVHGIDQSSVMLDEAERQRESAREEIRERLTFSCADARNLDLGVDFDAVVALFHVMSYQTTNADFLAVLKSVHGHLREGGLFFFDCWYGPAVLTEQPEVRVKELSNDSVRVLRIAEPQLLENENIVEVNYRILITGVDTKVTEEIREQHRMRYVFVPEIRMMLDYAGFRLIDVFEYGSGRPPGVSTWGVGFVAARKPAP